MNGAVTAVASHRLGGSGSARARAGLRLLLSLAGAIIVISVIFLALGAPPIASFKAIVKGALGSDFKLGQTAMMTALLALTGLAAAIPFSARLWNVGGEGQLYMGAFAAAALGLGLPESFPAALAIPLIVIASALAGSGWAGIAGYLKAQFETNEVIVTLMLTFIAVLVVNVGVNDLWPSGTAQTADLPVGFLLPNIWSGTLVNAGALIAIGAVVIAAIVMFRLRLGVRIRAVGINRDAARLAGVSDRRTIVAAFALGGACAGLAGGIAVQGISGSLIAGFSANFGYLGIAVALLARLNPLWIIPSAALFAVLRVGSSSLQVTEGISPTMAEIIAAVFVVLLLAFGVISTSAKVSR